MKLKMTCIECGKEFFANPSAVKRGEGKYCKRSCHLKAKAKKSPDKQYAGAQLKGAGSNGF